jgi:hypothetical protein
MNNDIVRIWEKHSWSASATIPAFDCGRGVQRKTVKTMKTLKTSGVPANKLVINF